MCTYCVRTTSARTKIVQVVLQYYKPTRVRELVCRSNVLKVLVFSTSSRNHGNAIKKF